MSDSEMTTWDGKAISPEPPHGATIVVYRQTASGREFLILHRAQANEPDGAWAWTPPSGARYPGESIDDCARRELLEETGLALPIHRTQHSTATWYTYCAEANPGERITLDAEHDQYAWVSADIGAQQCLPEFVGAQITCVAQDLAV